MGILEKISEQVNLFLYVDADPYIATGQFYANQNNL